MKMLLTSVFGPYGVDDEYGEKENIMELFHNQVTREQGIFSYRFNHPSHGLYFLAANVDVPTTVLDFPTLERFEDELWNGYDYVGISFIIPNMRKAQRMAKLVREKSPDTKIILGGHGVSIPGVEEMVEHDYICHGEGVKFLRELFGEDVDGPIQHALSYSSYNRRIMGVPWAPDSGIIITGVGCVNRCRFCATSHFFGDYTPFLKTGQEIFDVCCDYEDRLGVTDFGILDENFLKTKDRALELLEIMEARNRHFTFAVFSSAETLTALGDLDILVRLGINFLWMGVESKVDVHEKNRGVDFHKLFAELRKRGISVMASAILFLEHHDKETLWDDVDFITSLNADYVQFMQLAPIPGTALYKDYRDAGKLIDAPYHTQHGQKYIWFHHPHFTPEESDHILRQAFVVDYKRNGASMLRAIETVLQGYDYCTSHADERIRARAATFRASLKLMRYFVFSSRIFADNDGTRSRLAKVQKLYRRLFGISGPVTWCMSLVVLVFAVREHFRIVRRKSNNLQPPPLRHEAESDKTLTIDDVG